MSLTHVVGARVFRDVFFLADGRVMDQARSEYVSACRVADGVAVTVAVKSSASS